MPAVHHRGIVLDRQETGERHLRLRLLSPEAGLLSAWWRRRTKDGTASVPDLFDSAEFSLDLKPDPSHLGLFGFLREYRVEVRRPELGRRFGAFSNACWLARFILANGPHHPEPGSWYLPLEKALQGWTDGRNAEAVLIKVLFLMVRREGYAVQESWQAGLSGPMRSMSDLAIRSPLETLALREEDLLPVRQSLVSWVLAETDFSQ